MTNKPLNHKVQHEHRWRSLTVTAWEDFAPNEPIPGSEQVLERRASEIMMLCKCGAISSIRGENILGHDER